MLNKYPVWKYLVILSVLLLGIVYALPNLYPPDPAIQISSQDSTDSMDERVRLMAEKALQEEGIAFFGVAIDGRTLLIRLKSQDQQLVAQSAIKRALKDGYVVALNLAPSTPEWLSSLGAQPMKLGLDLRGGVHFLLEVDTGFALAKRLDGYVSDVKSMLREVKLRGLVDVVDGDRIVITFKEEALRDQARSEAASRFPELVRQGSESQGAYTLELLLSEQLVREIEKYAVSQNMTTLRNRVNELGVAEPIVQQQGKNRIVVELPGVQDTAEAKRILGKTANLEFRLEAGSGASPSEKERFEFRSDSERRSGAWLEKKAVITGERVSNAQPAFDENGRPQVSITLDGQGGKLMHRSTRNNIKRNLGVLFIERKTKTRFFKDENGVQQTSRQKYDEKKIISLATIQSALGTQFRITGLDSSQEAAELALLLRAGALAAPLDFVEERTVGPSLGAENIAQGVLSVQIGLLLVVVCMMLVYRVFGFAAVLGLGINLVLMLAVMSLFSATLTLPGIAGIVLTVGMAVDANVLIFSRIREELATGASPQMALNAGFERAFVTIVDANITTFIAAFILFAVGTGPVKGFAVTLSVGIVTSMFTAIMCTRAIVNLIYGGRQVEKLHI
jgi:preprotein translocase subunit SecD